MLETRQEVDIFEINLDPKEHKLDEQKVQDLEKSILENGLISPIAVGPGLELLAGYHRLEAYKRLYQKAGDEYRHIAVRMVDAEDVRLKRQLETTEKLFHPELSILEKAEYFKNYFDGLKYGQVRHKTTTIFKTLDISRRTFFNLRAIAERLTPKVRDRILNSSLSSLSNSTPQLLALCKYDEQQQLQVLETMESHHCGSVFEAIKLHQKLQEIPSSKGGRPKKFLKSPSLKLDKELRQELRQLSQHTGLGQNELFNEIFALGLDLVEQKYR